MSSECGDGVWLSQALQHAYCNALDADTCQERAFLTSFRVHSTLKLIDVLTLGDVCYWLRAQHA